MSYSKKTWKDRVSEYPNRRLLTDTSGTETLVTVTRSEGTIAQEGDAFSAANMNDLEKRVSDEFSNIGDTITDLGKSVADGKALVATAISNKGVTVATDATWQQLADAINSIVTDVKHTVQASGSSASYGNALKVSLVIDGVTVQTAQASGGDYAHASTDTYTI